MKKTLIIIAAVLTFNLGLGIFGLELGAGFAQGVAINTAGTVADNSAILDVSSTTKGQLVPRMTLAQRNNLIGSDGVAGHPPATACLIYQTDNTPGYYYYDGSQWVQAIGPTGITGSTGSTGEIGATGLTGAAGANGTNGTNGNTGATGLTGVIGNSGIDGITGSTGPSGINGATGATGITGSTGTNGTTGATGPLVAGTSGQTLRHDGTGWIANSVLYNNGTSVGIGTSGPTGSAILDVSCAVTGSTGPTGSRQGVLIPRISLASTTDIGGFYTPVTSLMVYNQATVNDVTPGFYYWNGTKWVQIGASSSANAPCYTCNGY